MSKKLLLQIAFLLLPALCFAQRVQRIKGSVADKESKTPLVGVTVSVTDVTPTLGAVTDASGKFID